MRVGDKVRAIQVALIGGLAPGLVFGLLAWVTGRVPVWWSVFIGIGTATLAIWAAWTFFGIAHLERMAARAAHGGRHYYFGQQEIRVVFDDADGAWLRLADVRCCIGGDAARIRHFLPSEATTFSGSGRHVYLSEPGVRRYVAVTRHPDLQKFMLWFERDFIAPLDARRARNLPLHGTGSGRI